MNIPEELLSRMLSELNYVISKIQSETDPKRKMYFLSAAHGAVERTIRFHSDGELYLVHFTLNILYSTINGLLNRIAAGDTAVMPPGDLWDRLTQFLTELSQALGEGRSTYPIIEQISILSYSLTGPGYYTLNYLNSLEAPNP